MTKQRNTKDNRFPTSLFAIYLGVLFLMSGVHTGLLVLMERLDWYSWIEVLITMLYWIVVAAGVTIFTRTMIKTRYDKPMLDLADAASSVANGDFSVYVPTVHTADKLDYLDYMIINFNKMVEELGSIETLKTDFVSNVSHEMKTPLAIIKNYAQMLERGDITQEERKEYAAVIDGAATRLSDLISNILKLNKLENQSIVPETESYDLCRQLTECVLNFEEIWESKSIEMDIDIEDEVFIRGDRSLLDIVWNNILSNALKFTEAGGTVSVSQTSDDKEVRVQITDTGCGMSAEAVNHIFDKFYQGDTSHSKEGNGLGLALAKRIMDLSNGDITVLSEEGKGSTFVLTLPKSYSGRKTNYQKSIGK